MSLSRRLQQFRLQLVGRHPSDYAQELQEFLKSLWDEAMGIPGGWLNRTPTTISPDSTGSSGTQASGWAAADHAHPVVTDTAVNLGDALAEGSASSFSRSDHIHKLLVRIMKAAATIGTRRALNFTDSTSIAVTATDDAGNDRVNVSAAVVAPGSAPTTIQPDDAAAVGAGPTVAYADHVHAIAADVPVAIGGALAEGVSTAFARSDHVHTLDAPAAAPTTIQPDDAASTGAGPTRAYADHVHAIVADVPVALGDALAEGASTSFSRADHVHALAVRVAADGAALGTRKRLNFASTAGLDGVTFTGADNPGSDEVDISANISFNVPYWHYYRVTHAQLQAAAMANDIELFSLPAGGVIQMATIAPITPFAGPGITDYKVSVGIGGNLTKYAAAFDVDTPYSGTNFQLSTVIGLEDEIANTSIKIAATSAGANLDQSTAGDVDVLVLWGIAG